MKVGFCRANKIVIPDWMLPSCNKNGKKCEWFEDMEQDQAIMEVNCAAQTSLLP